ncbi:MAG: PP2C family protein-serine/threonine phosphatase [Terriglobales bacterium]
MTPDAQVLSLLRNQIGGIALGSVFLFLGVGAIALTLLRSRRDIGLVVWFGIFSAMYGARMLAQSPAAFSVLPQPWWDSRPYVIAVITYSIFVPALLFWLGLSIGGFCKFLRAAAVFAGVFAVIASAIVLIRHVPFAFVNENSIFVIVMMLILGVVNAFPSLARRCLRQPSAVLAAGALVLAIVALLTNIGTFVKLPNFQRFEPVSFAVFVLSLGYVAAQRVFANERRLLTIENELEIAREIQQSILPTSVPQMEHLRVAASYLPMTSVAGDFYEFIHLDDKHAGFLVADVSGHGVPAALIASMIKVAMHSVSSHAEAPAEVLGGLNEILSHQLRGQFVTAAYLYVDLERRRALYSGAGHPPLLYWNAAETRLENIESNGLLFGVLKQTDYPVRELSLRAGDRFLLYTDGLVEAENDKGQVFGDGQLQEMIAANTTLPATELSVIILEKLGRWQSQSGAQQDDVTLIVIDVP